ncbi:LOW QUALITY PROTEIN: uncharacterized protein QC763_511160 [Podospora pseudopauciseta]|uniref:Uncharacterized protein n=1 Tax=Podospora pseudopauciseta TaxID=2093780 RepID=A0ABR0HB86_9PEZI|nr:LOW QUALITY PROTEIN: hypothetical protein QC763_511160 [Podospora pseudopauciseta]
MVSPGTFSPVVNRDYMVNGLLQPRQIESLEKAYSQLEVLNAREPRSRRSYHILLQRRRWYGYERLHISNPQCLDHGLDTPYGADKGGRDPAGNVDVLSVKANVQVETVAGVPVYYGADAGVYLADAEAGPFHGTLGLAADTEIGCRDQSVGCKVLGCGVRVGRVCEISALGSGLGIDLGKFKWR